MKNKKAMQKYAVMIFSIVLIVSIAVFTSAYIPIDDPATDTDGGFVTGTRGTCSGTSGGGTDYCISSTQLREYHPDLTACRNTVVSCPCSNGVCGSTSTVDTDGGNLPFMAGECRRWVSGAWQVSHDYWNSGSNLFKEYYKSGNSCLYETYYCGAAILISGNRVCIGALDEEGDDPTTPSTCAYGPGTPYRDEIIWGVGQTWLKEWYPDGNDCVYQGYICGGYHITGGEAYCTGDIEEYNP